MVRENPAGVSGDEIGIAKYYESADNRQPITDNYLNNNSFKFSIGKVPLVTYFCQKANVPADGDYIDPIRHQSSAELLILSSAYNPIYSVQFAGVFPINLSSIDFDSSVTETEPVVVTATFQYRTFDITPV